jgi:hypothetical protein
MQYSGSVLRKQTIHMRSQAKKNGARRPRLKSESTESALPRVRIAWTEKQLASLAKLLTSEPAKPTDALVRAMKGESTAPCRDL